MFSKDLLNKAWGQEVPVSYQRSTLMCVNGVGPAYFSGHFPQMKTTGTNKSLTYPSVRVKWTLLTMNHRVLGGSHLSAGLPKTKPPSPLLLSSSLFSPGQVIHPHMTTKGIAAPLRRINTHFTYVILFLERNWRFTERVGNSNRRLGTNKFIHGEQSSNVWRTHSSWTQ